MTQTAKNYGNALYELARDEGLSEDIYAQFSQVTEIFSQTPDYIRLLSTPTVSKQERCAVLDEAFGGRLQPYLLNFLKILCQKGYIRQHGDCFAQYRSRYNEDHGILSAVAVTAAPLTPVLREKLVQKLCTVTGKQVHLELRVDPSVLGGVRLEMDGRQLDGTVKQRLNTLRQSLSQTVL